MKNYEEIRGLCFRQEFDKSSKAFVMRMLGSIEISSQFEESGKPGEGPQLPMTAVETSKSCAGIENASQDKKLVAAGSPIVFSQTATLHEQPLVSPRAIRSRACISLSRILPR